MASPSASVATPPSEAPTPLEPLAGWGRFPVERAHVIRPASQRALARAFEAAPGTLIARGLGRSYGDAALNAGGSVVETTALDRFLAFDPATGVLACEAGATLHDVVTTFLPRGFFPAVTPGTRFVTIGGAIANDVHGKNHHRVGGFGEAVLDFELLLPSGETITCSRERHAEIFWATIGGLGLTGLIRRARIRLKPVETAYVRVDYTRTRDLDDTLARFAATDDRYEYSVAWIDCLARGRSLGRSVLMQGNPATPADLPAGTAPLASTPRRRPGVPFVAPGGLLNPTTVAAFNAAFYARHRTVAGRVTPFEPYFYPLDAIAHWNRAYGPRGFLQYQVALPEAAGPAALAGLLERLSAARAASFLAVLKRFGPAGSGLLSFPMAGWTLALDLPYADGLVPFLHGLDDYVAARGGRVYLAKEAVLTAASFEAMYPAAERFRAIRRELDPEGRLASSMSRRLGL